ncbi:MAG: hypothetical protein AAB558_01340 [Patescibacteria group bacterium]
MSKLTIQASTATTHLVRLSTASTVLTNHQFYIKCVRVGSTAKTAVREFLALLPEAEERKVYLEHGMSSIFEFAAKLGGVSREQVQRVLQLSERFETTPALKQALMSGDISLAKLARVASVATPENQDFWVSKADLLSQPALETLVRDSKAITSTDSVRSHSANLNKTANIQKVEQSDELKLKPQIRQRLLVLQNKGLDLSQLLEELLDEKGTKNSGGETGYCQRISREDPIKLALYSKKSYSHSRKRIRNQVRTFKLHQCFG